VEGELAGPICLGRVHRDLDLDSVEPLIFAEAQILGRLLGSELGEDLPAGVRVIKEGLALLGDKVTLVLADL